MDVDEVDVLVIPPRVGLRGGHQARAEIDPQPLETARDRRRAAAVHPQDHHHAARRSRGNRMRWGWIDSHGKAPMLPVKPSTDNAQSEESCNGLGKDFPNCSPPIPL